MRIMVLADVESKSLWDFFDKTKLEGIDLIISCGDLSPRYLSFLATFTKAPVLYVHGNHDGCYEETPPEGCICIDDQIYQFEGLRILGLGGSMKYKPGPHMFTQKEMKKRVRKLWFQLHRSKGFDILVGHAPAYQINDGDDMPHVGFEAFVKLMQKYQPRYFFHGHVHANYGGRYKRLFAFEQTVIVNGYQEYQIEYEQQEELLASLREKQLKKAAEEMQKLEERKNEKNQGVGAVAAVETIEPAASESRIAASEGIGVVQKRELFSNGTEAISMESTDREGASRERDTAVIPTGMRAVGAPLK